MAVTLRDSKVGFGTLTTATATAIVPAGTNRFGLVKVGWFNNTTVSSVTWGGVDITANLIKSAVHDGSSRKRLAFYYYLDPPASSGDVIVTTAANVLGMSVIAEAWDNVDQTTPYADLTFTADGATQTADPHVLTVTATSGKIITDCTFQWNAGGNGTTATVSGDQTIINSDFRNFGGGGTTGHFGSSYATSDGSVDMTWDLNNAATQNWCMYAISLTEASGGGGPTPGNSTQFLNLLSVGT